MIWLIRTPIHGEEGVQALLLDVTKVPEKIKSQVGVFLQDIVIVDSIRVALALRSKYPGKTFVTLDGDTLTAEGVLTGGTSESASSGVLKRKREIKELSEKREEWAGKLSLAKLSLEKLSKQIKTVNIDLENSKKKKYEHEIFVAELKKDLERADNELNNAQSAMDKQSQVVSQKDEKLLQIDGVLSEIRSSLEDLKTQKLDLEAKSLELENELNASKSGIDKTQSEVQELKVDSVSKQRELESMEAQKLRLEHSLNELNSNLEEMTNETEKSVETLSSNSVLIEEEKLALESHIFAFEKNESDLALAKEKFEKTFAESRELEEKINLTNKSLNEYKSNLNDAQLKLEQLKMKELYIVEHVQEKYLKDIKEIAPEFAQETKDFAEVEVRLSDLKEKLGKMGEVNLSAIDEFDHLKERYEFLNQQHQDLVDAKKQLTKVIDRINKICSVRFKETFDLVNDRFQKGFSSAIWWW